MSLTTISIAKELSQGYQPIILAEIEFQDGSYLRVSTHDFRLATTGVQWNGNDYLPRIINKSFSSTQALPGTSALPLVPFHWPTACHLVRSHQVTLLLMLH
jgi:hypothetical protein